MRALLASLILSGCGAPTCPDPFFDGKATDESIKIERF